MITTSEIVTITKVLRLGPVTTYSLDGVSLFIKNNGDQKRYNATSLVNSREMANGLITFENIPLVNDGSYSFYVTAETNTDMDTNGTNLVKLATGYIKKITSNSILAI